MAKFILTESQAKILVFEYMDHYIEPYNLIKKNRYEGQITWETPDGEIIISYFQHEKQYTIPLKMVDTIMSFFPQTLPLNEYTREWLENKFGYECNWLAYDENEDDYD